MISFELALRRVEHAAPAAAWLIPGAEPETWIDEISRWGIAMADLRLFLLPRSLHDPRPLGALVTGMGSLSSDRVHRGQPYRLLADRLYIPADAELNPAATDEELGSLLVWQVQVLHPSAGLVGCRHEEALRVVDLLLPPARRTSEWNRAGRVAVYATRLVSIEAESPPTLEIILEQGRDGIASQSPGLLPPSDDESKLDQALARAVRPGLEIIRWMAAGRAAGKLGGNWTQRLRQWASRRLELLDHSLLEARFKELRRLQKLFDVNPDEALKFALPLRDRGTRGRATPDWRLGQRTPRYDASRLSGGTPGDVWDIPQQTQHDLLARYRQAANRELSLHRYLRAAYVFAELLGDFSAAANALVQGRYFREAAMLYRDRLKNPAAAAGCFKDGGLLLEAAEIYEQLGEYEQAGDLHAKVEHREHAVRCYRQAVERALRRDDHLEAARLLESKLNLPDEALEVLFSQWPGSRSAAACLAAYFDLLQKLNRQEHTLRFIADLRDKPLPVDKVQPLAQILAGLTKRHPSPAVRVLAADATRVVAGRRLAAAGGPEARALVSAVTGLCPDDRLLLRDGARFLNPGAKLASSAGKAKLVAEFLLPAEVTWKSAISTGDSFFAIGLGRSGRAVIAHARWSGPTQKLVWPQGLNPEQCLLVPGPHSGKSVLLIPLSTRPPGSVSDAFIPTDRFPEPCRAGIPDWLPDQIILGAGQDEHGTLWIAHNAGEPETTLSAFACEAGQLLATYGPFGKDASEDGGFASGFTSVVARNGQVFLINGNTVFRLAPGRAGKPENTPILLPANCIAAVGAPLPHRMALAIAFEEGGAVLFENGSRSPFGHGMNQPRIGFTRGGALVAVEMKEATVYRSDGEKLWRQISFPMEGNDVIAVCAATKLNEVGMIESNGRVRVFELSTPRI